jgi:hypothetical protein
MDGCGKDLGGADDMSDRTHALATLAQAGALEGMDWRWGGEPEPGCMAVVDTPHAISVADLDVTLAEAGAQAPAPVILVSASAVRKLGGLGTAAKMDAGELPAETQSSRQRMGQRP